MLGVVPRRKVILLIPRVRGVRILMVLRLMSSRLI